MALTKCSECGGQLSTKAEACPHCGARAPQSVPLGCTITILLVLVIVLFIIYGSAKNDLASSVDNRQSRANTVPSHTPSTPSILLLEWSWRKEHGYAIAEGEIKNVSSKNIRNIEAVVSYYTAEKVFITSDKSVVEYNPLLPNQITPFTIYTRYNPEMSKASIAFKELFGGTIQHTSSEEE